MHSHSSSQTVAFRAAAVELELDDIVSGTDRCDRSCSSPKPSRSASSTLRTLCDGDKDFSGSESGLADIAATKPPPMIRKTLSITVVIVTLAGQRILPGTAYNPLGLIVVIIIIVVRGTGNSFVIVVRG